MKTYLPLFSSLTWSLLLLCILAFQCETMGQEPLLLSYEREMDLDHPFPAILTDQDFALVTTEESFDQFATLQNDNVKIWSTLINDSPDFHGIYYLYEHESGYYYTGEGGLPTHSSFGRLNKISGNIEVQETFTDPDSGGGRSMALVATYGNNFMVGGYTHSNANGLRAILRIVNPLGELLSTKTSNDNGGLWGDIIYQILKTTDGGYLLAGLIEENNNCGEISNKSLWLCKLNANLNVIWSRKYGDGNGSVSKSYGSDYFGPKCIILNTNEIVVLGVTFCTDGNGGGPNNIGEGTFLMKLDASGNIETINLIDINLLDYTKSYTDIEVACGDYFVLSGVQGGFIGSSYLIEKFDYDLMPIEYMLSVADLDKTTRYVNIHKGKSGSYLLVGEKYYYDNDGNYHADEFIAKTSADPGCAHCNNIPLFATYGDCEDFDGLLLGDISPQGNPRFTLFDNDPFHQAEVVDNAPGNSGQALLFGNSSDIDYNIGRTIQTPARLEWNIYFPVGKDGSWGLETLNPDDYALVVEYENGTATVSSGTMQTTFSYPQNVWMPTALVFSPDNNTIQLWSSGEIKFTITNYTSNKVTDLNFYYTFESTTNQFYVDDVLYYEISSDCDNEVSGGTVCVNGTTYDFESQALCAGYSPDEWTIGECCSGFSVSQNVTQTSCGLSNGSITVLPQGGSDYTYLWSNGSSSQTVSSLAAGSYSVTVTSVDGCMTTNTFTINNSSAVTLNTNVVQESCNDCNNGQITVTPAGGNGFTYLWSNGATTQSISNLAPGTYTVTVTASNGCTATTTVAINEFGCPGITLAISKTDPPCFGDCNGTATATPIGGNLPYTYQWSNGATTQIANGLCPGGYTVTIVDATGCVQTESVTITPGAQLFTNITQLNGTITAIGNGGTQPYGYAWNTGETTASITPDSSGTYTVIITDANGCVTTVAIEFVYTSSVQIQAFQGKIYPNPAQSFVYIELPEWIGHYDISVYSVNGGQIENLSISSYGDGAQIDVASLNPGMYILKIVARDIQYTSRIIRI